MSGSGTSRKKIRIAADLSDLVVYCQPVSFSPAVEDSVLNFQVRGIEADWRSQAWPSELCAIIGQNGEKQKDESLAVVTTGWCTMCLCFL